MRRYISFFPIALCVVTLLAGVLRISGLSQYPTGFHTDEASLGYNGYSLLKTGKDDNGNRFPLYIDIFGDNRPSGYHYLTVIPVAVFGLTEFATRLPGALFGTISVIALFFLVKAISKNNTIALTSSFLLAIAPWHVVSSRASAESIVSLFFIISGVTFLLYAFDTKRIRFLTIGSILLITSFFFYHTPRVFVPLLIIGIALLKFRERKMFTFKFKLTGVVCCIVIGIISFLLVFVVNGGTGRFSQVSIFGFPETKLILEEQIREDGTKNIIPNVCRFFHNKIINYSLTFANNYLDYFSGKFLFISGGRPLWYKVPNMGLVYLVELPFIIVGFIYLSVQKNAILSIPIMWLFIAPVVASITMDDIPNVQRVMVLFPMLEVMAGFGIVKIVSLLKKTKKIIFLVILCIGMVFSVAYFIHQYTVHGASHETIYRSNGFKELMQNIRGEYDSYDTVIFTKSLGGYPLVLFYMTYDPAMYHKEGSPKDKDYKGFGKFIFTSQACPSIDGDDNLPKTGRILYVNNGVCKISPLFKQKKILREDGSVAFILVGSQE